MIWNENEEDVCIKKKEKKLNSKPKEDYNLYMRGDYPNKNMQHSVCLSLLNRMLRMQSEKVKEILEPTGHYNRWMNKNKGKVKTTN